MCATLALCFPLSVVAQLGLQPLSLTRWCTSLLYPSVSYLFQFTYFIFIPRFDVGQLLEVLGLERIHCVKRLQSQCHRVKDTLVSKTLCVPLGTSWSQCVQVTDTDLTPRKCRLSQILLSVTLSHKHLHTHVHTTEQPDRLRPCQTKHGPECGLVVCQAAWHWNFTLVVTVMSLLCHSSVSVAPIPAIKDQQ